jgi:hypothetical protein
MSIEQGDVVRYDAFISYSRAADDDLAPDLQRSLERLSKPWYSRKPFLRVLRDTTSFGASADLTRTITSSLDEAGHLVLLISPESARSPWTTQEVEHWLATKGPDTITSVITEWEADRGLPPGDLNDLNDFDWKGPDVPPSLHGVSEAPLAVDLRWATDPADRTLDNARWRDAVAQTAAAIKGVKKDELIGELVTMRTQARIITSSLITGGVILLGVLVVALTLWLLAAGERDDAVAERDRADAAAGDADARRLQAEQAEASATAAAAEAEAARREAEALTLEARARQAEAEGNAAEAEALRGQAEEQRDAADAASVEAAAAAARAADLRDEAVADAAAAQSAADASRLEAATQRMVRESLALATAAADAISSDLPLALSNALASYQLAQDAVGDRQPGDTFISGDQNALGTLFDALTAHRRLVGAVSGEFARAATSPSGRLAAVEIPDRGVVLLDSTLELPDDRPSVGGGRVSFFPSNVRGATQERFVVARYRDVALHDVPDSLDDIAETTGVLTWPGPGGVLVAAADSTGEWIAGGTDRGELAVWRVGSPDPVARLDVAERINDVEFDPVSGAIAWGGVGRDDRAAGIVTLSSAAGVPAMIEQPAPAADFFEVSDISFQPCATSSCLLTLASRGAPLTFWEVSGGSATTSPICEQRCPMPGVAVGWSADGARFGVGDDTGGIEVWSWSDGDFTPLATDIGSPAGFNSSI